MKIFVDTNIFLDLILKSMGMDEALLILNACEQDIFEGYIADITLLNIDYVGTKQSADMKEFLTLVNKTFSVIGADNTMFDLALNINNKDLEDNIQYLCAKKSASTTIITNDKNFYKDDIKVLSSKVFVDQYL